MKFVFADNTIHWMGALIMMKPVNHYNMLAEAQDVGYQPEDALFVQYLNLILDQEGENLEDESMLLEQNYVNVIEPTKRNIEGNIIIVPKAFRRKDWRCT